VCSIGRNEEVHVQLQGLKARMRRLAELSQGFAVEASRLKHGKGEFPFLERVRYLSAIEDARSWLERARAALANVCAHLEEREEQRRRIVTQE
jgi:hypothetical protein